MANVDLLPVLSTDAPELWVCSKKAAAVQLTGMECIKEKLPDLSHTYLLFSDKVGKVLLLLFAARLFCCSGLVGQNFEPLKIYHVI